MNGRLTNGLVKITGWLPQKLVFRMKIYYENKSVQSRKISGPAIIISNHTSVFDYAAFIFVFFGRTLRYQMAEVLFKKKVLGLFLRMMGGIYVNRDSNNYSFIAESESILKKGGVVGIFPEGRLPRPGEDRPLPFKTGAALIALNSNAKIIPVYTSGGYFKRGKSKIIIGKPIDLNEVIDEDLSSKEALVAATEFMREKVIQLGKMLDERTEEKK